jgi:lipopolysaccharide/colanic/teichoic acid biosynthesis glycosyltransferase
MGKALESGVPVYPTPRAKRWMDVTLATLALAVLWPIWLLACVLVRLDSPGPILLRQKRVGKDGRLFQFYKFRTLARGEEDLRVRLPQGDLSQQLLSPPGPNPWAGAIGRALRATTVDELPQLLNVIKGDMSLVGPRPDLPEIVSRWPPYYLERHKVKPGMTGLAQINGRSDLTYEEKIKYDLEYVRYHPLRRDIEILWRTVWLVLSKRGAR